MSSAAFLRYPDPGLAELIALQDFDFLVLDGEHGTMDVRECENLVRACEVRGATPLVRVPANDPPVILRFLDTGAMGVHVPLVGSAEEAEAAVRAVTAAIAAVEGVDVLFIGPTDLSEAFGVTGQLSHPRVEEAYGQIIHGAHASGKAIGVLAGDETSVLAWRERGARYVAVTSDSPAQQPHQSRSGSCGRLRAAGPPLTVRRDGERGDARRALLARSAQALLDAIA
jgi:4-hydroxy-2-oxoheptanedioate aldolase